MPEKKIDYLKTELAKYNLSDAKIAALKNKYIKLKVKSMEDIDNYMACKSAHQEMKGLRIAIEKKRVELKSSSVAFGKAVDTEAKRLIAGVSEIEDHLLTQRRVVEDEKKRLQEEQERKVQEEQNRIKREEEERLEKIRLDQEAEAKRLKGQQDKIDAANRKVEEEKESNRLEKERLEKEKIDAEAAKKRAIQDEKDRVVNEKKRAEELEKAKKEAAEKAKKEEQEKVIREKKEKELADFKAKEAKIEAEKKASDKDKLLVMASGIKSIKFPDVKSTASEKILEKVDELLKQAYKLLTEAK